MRASGAPQAACPARCHPTGSVGVAKPGQRSAGSSVSASAPATRSPALIRTIGPDLTGSAYGPQLKPEPPGPAQRMFFNASCMARQVHSGEESSMSRIVLVYFLGLLAAASAQTQRSSLNGAVSDPRGEIRQRCPQNVHRLKKRCTEGRGEMETGASAEEA